MLLMMLMMLLYLLLVCLIRDVLQLLSVFGSKQLSTLEIDSLIWHTHFSIFFCLSQNWFLNLCSSFSVQLEFHDVMSWWLYYRASNEGQKVTEWGCVFQYCTSAISQNIAGLLWCDCTALALQWWCESLCHVLRWCVRQCDCITDVFNQKKCLIAVKAISALTSHTAPCVEMMCALMQFYNGCIQSGNWLITVKAVSALAACTASYVEMMCAPVPLHCRPVQ